MAKSMHKIALSGSRDIPFNRLVLSQSNVRRVKAGVSIDELAQDIARRTLLQSLTVRPVLDCDGAETGICEIPAGGRRYRALELLVKQKRLARTAPIPCIVRSGGLAEEDSLAENVQRAPLHPLDQFRAFLTLCEKGMSEDEIAASFFVSNQVVKQRLKLASVSPKLLDTYAEEGMTLEQLMAFTVNPDHERQEQVWEAAQRGHTKEPYHLRRLMIAGAVRACDKRAQFVGISAYQEGGGDIMRDLFQQDDGGWLQDPFLLDRLVAEKLEHEASQVRSEGWKWVDVAIDFPYGHTYGLRHIAGAPVAMSEEEAAAAATLRAECEQLEQTYADADELPAEIDQRLGEIETALATLDSRPMRYEADEVVRAGAFVSVDPCGALRIERGYVRPEDEPPVSRPEPETYIPSSTMAAAATVQAAEVAATMSDGGEELRADEDVNSIPDRLMTELTAYRTLALRDALAQNPDVASLAILHVLCLALFYHDASESCLEIGVKSIVFGGQAPGLNDTIIAKSVDERHLRWSDQLPQEPVDLWATLLAFDADSRQALFAHCVALSVNAVNESWNRRTRAIAHADRVAQALDLDAAAAGWTPTVDNFLGRVAKARILQAVREVKGEAATQHIAHLKKGEMAERAQELLAGSRWLPDPLRTPGQTVALASETSQSHALSQSGEEQSAASDGETAMADPLHTQQDQAAEIEPHSVAAE